ncbi:MAG TPA: hypothetical protein VHK47_04375 [Polyangia bacterium]|jgi:hypothetical protein|nr:hypothetical protein [Polyangia bacterium]
MRAIATGLLAGLCLSSGCGKSNGLLPAVELPPAATCTGQVLTATENSSVDSISENVDSTCVSVVDFLDWKYAATGAACKTPLDCTPVCVPCPNGTHHTLASWCNEGICAAPNVVACMVAGTPGLARCSK